MLVVFITYALYQQYTYVYIKYLKRKAEECLSSTLKRIITLIIINGLGQRKQKTASFWGVMPDHYILADKSGANVLQAVGSKWGIYR